MAKDRAPSFQFYPDNWLASMKKHGLSFDQQGRYWQACSLSWLTDTPGEADEQTWRRWMDLTPKQWERQREVLARPFTVRDDGVWIQERMAATRAEQIERRRRASEGAERTNGKRWGSAVA